MLRQYCRNITARSLRQFYRRENCRNITARFLVRPYGNFGTKDPVPLFGLHFGWKPIWLPFGGSSTNAARAIAEMLIAIPIPAEKASGTSLFCLDCEGTPIYHREADRILANLLKAAFATENCSRWSFHSLRIGAACALLKANASMELIQALCRWRSPRSVGIYARLGPADYGHWVLLAQRQQTDAVTARNLPRIDYDGIVGFLSGVADSLED